MKDKLFEMLIPKRPLSLQAKSHNLQAWKDYVYSRARNDWKSGTPYEKSGLRQTLVYLCDDSPADIDNIVKPIQDALVGVVYADDSLITDVDSHRRFITDGIDLTNLPRLLIRGAESGEECVYVSVSLAENLEVYL
ncbi:MAG: RusA family crossover junction endodeoxyribonuclease [Pseudanabaena sp.]|jgi:crossover junction endodeoxyribonuclease RusA|nr:RusA family crossover junction endodeoxyribonuclease [Pseudanabaena sp. M179S2SP2A07QC]MCA6611928.1 RusA family crossover junction endodeoxyribonuclease [Pseudanabaena sp. M158S2SP1A06QC]